MSANGREDLFYRVQRISGLCQWCRRRMIRTRDWRLCPGCDAPEGHELVGADPE